MPDLRLPRSERLRSQKSIRQLFGEGKGGFVYPYRYSFYISSESKTQICGDAVMDNLQGVSCMAGGIEVMFSVPKKFHKRANKRNLLKRRTREAYRLCPLRAELRCKLEQQSQSLDLALIYSTKEVHSYKTISNAVQRILEQVCAAM